MTPCFLGSEKYCHNLMERPVAFTSRTLKLAEKNYTQIEQEALALILIPIWLCIYNTHRS